MHRPEEHVTKTSKSFAPDVNLRAEERFILLIGVVTDVFVLRSKISCGCEILVDKATGRGLPSPEGNIVGAIFRTEIRKPAVDLCRRNLLGVESGGKKQDDESQFAELIEARFSSSLFLVHNLSFSSPCAVSIGSPASCRSIFRWCNCRTRTNYRMGSS